MKISVIVPVYNVENYLKECIDSLLNQNYKNLEIILVDDGSKDNSGRICDDYGEKYKNITVIHQKNAGPMKAVLAGIKISTGDYLGFIDSDDFCEADMFLHMAEKVEKHNCDIIVVGYKNFVNGEYKENPISVDNGFYDRKELVEKIIPTLINRGSFSFRSCIYLSRINKLFKKELILKNIEYFDTDINYGEDNILVIPCVLDAKSIYVMADYYPYCYRICDNESLTHRYHENLWKKFDSLNDVTEHILIEKGFNSQLGQIDYDAVFHAVTSIFNLFIKKLLYLDVIHEIKAIVNNDRVKRGVNTLYKEEKNKKIKLMLLLIKLRLAFILFCINKLNKFVKKL